MSPRSIAFEGAEPPPPERPRSLKTQQRVRLDLVEIGRVQVRPVAGRTRPWRRLPEPVKSGAGSRCTRPAEAVRT